MHKTHSGRFEAALSYAFVGLSGLACLRYLLVVERLPNYQRVAAWLAEVPQARTRTSAFARLAPVAT